MTGEGSQFDVPPAAIGRFRVLHQIGAGASGPVFRAIHPDTGAPLAIKLFTIDPPPASAPRLAEELDALVAALPPLAGVPRPVAAGVHGAAPYLVTSLAAGDALDVALRQFGPAALGDLVPRLQVLADALDTAAGHGIHHGALHPRDVMVSDSDTLVTGLGVWPLLARCGARIPIRRPYRAPELTDTAQSAAGDRFALAALAYEWMTGRRAPAAFVAGDMAPMPGADRDALGLVFARALHADPGARFESCAAFVAELAAADAGSRAAAAPAAGARARRRSRQPALPLDLFPAEGGADRPTPARTVTGEATTADAAPQPSVLEREYLTETTWDSSAPLAVEPLRSPREAAANQLGGWGRAAVGLVLGLVLGTGIGYLVWGRPVAPRAAGTMVEPAARAARPLEPASSPPAASPAAVDGDRVPARTAGGAAIQPAAALTGEAAPGAVPSASPDTLAAAPAAARVGRPSTVAPPAQDPPAGAPAGDRDVTPVSPPSAPLTGSLLVRSTPAGAAVFVDGERRGVTPLALSRVALGTRRVRVARDGFTAAERQVALTRARPSRAVDLRLVRAAPAGAPASAAAPAAMLSAERTGSLLVESRPPGAAVEVNGRPAGTTPLTLEHLAPGTYTVVLRLAAFRPVTTTVRVVADARARVAASLTSAQEP